VDNILTNLHAKFNYDRMRDEKVLGNRKSDNNKNPNNNNNNIGNPFPGPINQGRSQKFVLGV